MKKFAILALAAVVSLSMTSVFASSTEDKPKEEKKKGKKKKKEEAPK
ncbi:MAG: hypothetical protein NTV52_18015 [Acidobacteria bacterium]|nr:hypothetical protein [Acidobacteriota bacterium]